jgi:Site-specific DNA methylase
MARLLDLFSGAGGSAMGYHRAGFEVLGVDIKPQPRYPFPFVQADALEFLAGVRPGDFDLIHASPPCQAYSRLPRRGRKYPDLVGVVREELQRTGSPFIIENVVGAPLISPIVLCGLMFGLRTYRHRLFECSEFLMQIPHRAHEVPCPPAGRRGLSEDGFISVCGNISQMRFARRAMGIDWMTRDELTQAIPPAYTEFIGRQMR